MGAALPGTGLEGWARQFGLAGDWPEDLTGAPVIIDTDVGRDPGGTLALAAAARTVPRLALVITCSEPAPPEPGQRARLARRLLDLTGRPDVAVAEGAADDGADPCWPPGNLSPQPQRASRRR